MSMKNRSLVKKYARITSFILGVSLFMLLANVLSAGDIYEAEKATLNGAVVATNATGFSGSGFVDYVNSDSDYIEWNVNISKAGDYELKFQYALASGNRPLVITVNGVRQRNLDFISTGDFSTWQMTQALTVKLTAGVNHIRATVIGSSGANIDYLSIAKVTNVASINSIKYIPGKSITLNNTKISFKINIDNHNRAILSYYLDGKKYQAVKMLPELNGNNRGKIRYSITKNEGKSLSSTLIITAGSLRGSLRFSLDSRTDYLKLSEFTNIKKLQLKFSSSALVIPEISSEDMVIYPNEFKQSQLNIPSDNHLIVNMIDRGNAMISCIWNNNIELSQHRSANGKKFESIDLKPQVGDILWIGIDAARQIWFKPQVALNNKATKLQWRPPFAAKWFVTLRKALSDIEAENNHCDTWALADLNRANPDADTLGVCIVNQDGRAFSAEVGMYSYPFGQKKQDIYLAYPKFRSQENCYDKSFIPLIYTLKATTSKKYKTLPYNAMSIILDVKTFEKLYTVKSPHNRYQATCGRTKKIEKIFYRDESKKSKAKVRDYCEDMDNFILYHRLRIKAYREWAKKVVDDLQNYGEKYPDSVALTDSLSKDLNKIEQLIAKVNNIIKTPKYFKTLTAKIIKLADTNNESEEKERQCKKLGRKIRRIGGKQDHLIGMIRSVVKALRIRVTLLLLENQDPELRKMLKKLRQETAVILHTRLAMEGK